MAIRHQTVLYGYSTADCTYTVIRRLHDRHKEGTL